MLHAQRHLRTTLWMWTKGSVKAGRPARLAGRQSPAMAHLGMPSMAVPVQLTVSEEHRGASQQIPMLCPCWLLPAQGGCAMQRRHTVIMCCPTSAPPKAPRWVLSHTLHFLAAASLRHSIFTPLFISQLCVIRLVSVTDREVCCCEEGGLFLVAHCGGRTCFLTTGVQKC